jgi:hypothetical protein
MHVIDARNAEQALWLGLELLSKKGYRRASRNGEVVLMDGPVTTRYERPLERVVFWPRRDANPFFHLHEALWMLSGRNDVDSVAEFVGRMVAYSDDGVTFHGAYGHRWRYHFGTDQLAIIIDSLRSNPDDRRCVLQMWDMTMDLGRAGKDLPCNTQAYFSRNASGDLDMTVCCRSNDMIWGAHGANVVHFSVLQEYIAAGIGCGVGRYWQVSNNYHAYVDVFDKLAGEVPALLQTRYEEENWEWESAWDVDPTPLVSIGFEKWNRELLHYAEETPGYEFTDVLLAHASLARSIYRLRKVEGWETDALIANMRDHSRASDWKVACAEWLERRRK